LRTVLAAAGLTITDARASELTQEIATLAEQRKRHIDPGEAVELARRCGQQ